MRGGDAVVNGFKQKHGLDLRNNGLDLQNNDKYSIPSRVFLENHLLQVIKFLARSAGFCLSLLLYPFTFVLYLR